MIVSIDSSLRAFKSLTFHRGLNVLLADTQPGSSDKQTRNSAGKTSFVEIVHFLFGADCDPGSIFREPALREHSFCGEFLVDGRPIKVQRSGGQPSRTMVLSGAEDHPELELKVDKESGLGYVSTSRWKAYLGASLFRMPSDPSGSAFDKSYTPGLRSLFSYFARRRDSGGYISLERQAEKQQRWDWQVNLSYLLGLDWVVPHEFQKVRLKERTLDELKKAARGGDLGELFGTVAELRPKLTIAEERAERLRKELANFEVLGSYTDLTTRAARAKTTMQSLGREAISLRERLNHLRQAMMSETPPSLDEVESMYNSIGIALPGVSLRRLEDVSRFYSSVIENRALHLRQEIASCESKIATAEREMGDLSKERSEILRELEGRGALEDFLSMQRELADRDAVAASLRERYRAAELLEGESTRLTLARSELQLRLQLDHQERRGVLDDATLAVASIIGELYADRAGHLLVEATDNGPEFRISIDGDRGGGISNMEIFCFDLALFQLVTAKLGGPGFLLHDSHLFDGVDVRQVATGLMVGAAIATRMGCQYIVTLNSDIYNKLPIPEGASIDKYVLPTRLSDADETGGLFGIRF